MMRISTSQIYKQAIQNILSQQAKVNQTTAQISSGKQVSKPSEDPVGATKAHALRQEISNVENYLNNVKVVRNRLSLEELHLSEVGNILQRVRELHLQASNDTLNQSNRESIKVEMQQKLEEILAIANMKDAQGNYVYAGFQSSKEPFQLNSSGFYQYSGDEGSRRLQCGFR